MFHGNPSWSHIYRHLIKALRPEFRCIAPDPAGFGLSDPPLGFGYTPEEHADLVARFLDELARKLKAYDGPAHFICSERVLALLA